MHLEAVIHPVWMHLEAEMKLNSGIHLEVMIEQVWGCIWRPRSCN
jgi:hypothetical protein